MIPICESSDISIFQKRIDSATSLCLYYLHKAMGALDLVQSAFFDFRIGKELSLYDERTDKHNTGTLWKPGIQ